MYCVNRTSTEEWMTQLGSTGVTSNFQFDNWSTVDAQMSSSRNEASVSIAVVDDSLRNTDPFRCDNCGRTYRWMKTLMRHKRYECGKDGRFQCSYCPRKFKHKTDLKIHNLRKHNNELSEVQILD